MMMRRTLPLLVLLAGCGDVDVSAMAMEVRVDALLASEIASLSVFALGPRRSDNILLTCSTLMPRAIDPTDSRVDILARTDVVFDATTEVTLEKIEAGTGRIVYVGADDAAGTLIGNGCTENITVESGETMNVKLTVWGVPP